MELLYFVVSIIANFIVSALLVYCFDGYEFKWKDGKKVSVRMPSVKDLGQSADRHQISNYVINVINPAYHYFLLKEEFNTYESSHKVFSWIFLELSSILLTLRCFKKAFEEQLSDCDSLVRVLLYVLIVAVCALAYFVIYKVYMAKFAIDRIYSTEDSLRSSFEHRKQTEFDIDETTEWNNFLLNEHYKDVLLNVEGVRSREYVSKVLYGIAAAMYVLFFMSFSY